MHLRNQRQAPSHLRPANLSATANTVCFVKHTHGQPTHAGQTRARKRGAQQLPHTWAWISRRPAFSSCSWKHTNAASGSGQRTTRTRSDRSRGAHLGRMQSSKLRVGAGQLSFGLASRQLCAAHRHTATHTVSRGRRNTPQQLQPATASVCRSKLRALTQTRGMCRRSARTQQRRL